jgi:hypothetical protein
MTEDMTETPTLAYSDVPFYRKQWMTVVLVLLFVPAMIIIVLTGPIWQNSDGMAKQWEDKQRYTTAVAGVIFMLFGLAQFVTAM